MKLAIKGGERLINERFFSWPYADFSDEEALERVQKSGHYGPFGKEDEQFTRDYAKLNDTKHCLLVANGTSSLELIMRGLGIGRGDEVIIQGYTFIATFSSIIYTGAKPVFCDIDKDTYSMSLESVKKHVTDKTKAIIPVYVSGRPADLDELCAFAKERGIYLIGDAAQAVGASWKDKGIGSYGEAAAFSFQNSKNLTCGEGGAITTNSDALYESILTMLKNGLDMNMSAFQAGILNSQFKRFPDQLEKRQENARHLDKRLLEYDFVSPLKIDNRITKNAYHFYTLRIHEDKLKGISRDLFIKALHAEGLPICLGYTPLYKTNLVTSIYTKKQVGSGIEIDLAAYPNTEFAYKHEPGSIHQTTFSYQKRRL